MCISLARKYYDMLGAEITIDITVHINDSLIVYHFSDVRKFQSFLDNIVQRAYYLG
jgi:hypothetical protein